MSGKYQTFEPGKYLDWEKAAIEERLGLAQKELPKYRGEPYKVSEYEVLKFNNNFDPYNPLFNNGEYARKAGYQDVPFFPPTSIHFTLGDELKIWHTPVDIADTWNYAHGPDDVEMFAPIYPGDTLITEAEKLMFEDITVPGSNMRKLRAGHIIRLYNQKEELVMRWTNWVREGYRKIIDGSPKPSFSEVNAEWVDYLPPAHYTTDGEWEYIKELWRGEKIRGKDTLYWEDVKIGDEPVWTCSGPVTYMDMAKWYEGATGKTPATREVLMTDPSHLYRDRFGQYFCGSATMFGGRNIPGFRAIFFNDTGAKLITRMITNYIGDAGFITRIGWMFQQLWPVMQYAREGGEYLDKVPYMKGKACTHHGTEGDTVITKGYVTDKYVNDRGEHTIDLVCWGETLDRKIIQVVPASVRLPSKEAGK